MTRDSLGEADAKVNKGLIGTTPAPALGWRLHVSFLWEFRAGWNGLKEGLRKQRN